MPRLTGQAAAKSLSDLLAEVELRGRGWCYSDLGLQVGFSVPSGEAVLFHAVLHGSLRIACAGGAAMELGAGDVAIVLSGSAHALRTSPAAAVCAHAFLREDNAADIPPTFAFGAAGRVQARVLSGRLQADWPGDAGRQTLPPLLRIARADGAPAAGLLRPDALARAGMGAGSAAVLTRIAGLLLVAGLRADPGCRQLFAPPPRDPIAQAMRLIEGDPSADWTVERLARAVGMGRSNFAAHFTRDMARAPMEVVAERRMEHAVTLLQQPRLKIAEISELAGYSSEAAFSRRFTRHFGITPSQMRERLRAAAAEDAPARPAAALGWLSGRVAEGAAATGRGGRAASPATSPGEAPAPPRPRKARGVLFVGTRD